MIRSIEILCEPLTILFFTIVVFYSVSWLMGKFADLIGFEKDDVD